MHDRFFEETFSAENLFAAWDEFKKGKRRKQDVAEFEYALEERIFELQKELLEGHYRHGSYHGFWITDPKQRRIHKADVRDRVLHHAVFRALDPIFEPAFIHDSYSCRIGKGNHRGVERMASMLRTVSRNNTLPCFVLKCDIKKFFDSVDHEILLCILGEKVKDERMRALLAEIVGKFTPGIPIGNLTSQLFANVYMNELDQFVKHRLRIPHYIRYTDDFIVIHRDEEKLRQGLGEIAVFLKKALKLELHPHKVTLRKYAQGIDFLGYVQFPHHRLLRSRMKRKILKRARNGMSGESLQSYLGVLSHADSHEFAEKLRNAFFFAGNKTKRPGNNPGA